MKHFDAIIIGTGQAGLVPGGEVRGFGQDDGCHHRTSQVADAEFAEDLAIRYADTHFGPRSPNPSEEYGAERDRCMADLFEAIAKEHGVPVVQVSSSQGRNRAYIDVAEILPFALLYGLAAVTIARMNWRRYSPDDEGWLPGITMALFAICQ